MSLTARELALLDEELGELVGGVLREVRCPSATSIWVAVRCQGRTLGVLMDATPGVARVHLTRESPPQRDRPTGFVMLLRKRTIGARVTATSRVPGDRIWRLHLQRPDEPVDSLLLRWTHTKGNLYLLDSSDSVVLALSPRSADPDPLSDRPPPERVAAALKVDRLNLVDLPPDTSRSLCVQEHYNALIHDLEAKRVRLQRERRLRRALKSARRTAAKIAEDMARVERAPTWRRYGELLRSAYGHVEAGARSALVQDYYDPSLSEVEIPLDPKLDLSANIDRYFRRYRKYADARGKVLARQREMERQIHELERAIADPDASVSDLVRNRAISPRRQTQAATRTERAPYHEFLSESGLAILVGRGGRDNDTLTLRISRGRDVWLHAQDWAGAHVIIRLSKGESADHNTLLDAALLAAHYSKGRDDTITDVRYTAAKYVKKAKGAAPGRVTVAGGKTIAVRPDPKRLERLMRSRR